MGKSKYETHVKPYFDDIFYWYSHDWTLKQIAAELGVSKYTFLKYKNHYVDLFDLLKSAEKCKPRNLAAKAERSLRDKLKDREIEETETELWKDGQGKIVKQHIKKKKRIIPADTTAIIYALKNADPKRWDALQKALNDAQVKHLQADTPDGAGEQTNITIVDRWGDDDDDE